jgi:hypothetical protein
MILHLPPVGPAVLLQPEDLGRLSCEIGLPRASAIEAQARLRHVARLEDGHAWIRIGWLRDAAANAYGAEWAKRFEAMIDRARPHGWASDDGLSVKAHVVWQG